MHYPLLMLLARISTEAFTDLACGVAGDNIVWFHVMRDHGASRNDGTATDSDTAKHDGAVPNPDIISDHEFALKTRTMVVRVPDPGSTAQRSADCPEIVVVLPDQADVVANRHATSNAAIAHDRAVSADVRIVADGETTGCPNDRTETNMDANAHLNGPSYRSLAMEKFENSERWVVAPDLEHQPPPQARHDRLPQSFYRARTDGSLRPRYPRTQQHADRVASDCSLRYSMGTK